MPDAMAAADVLEREFLEMRAKILELAASFDRLERGDGSVNSDSRTALLEAGVRIVLEKQGGRAERVQLLFSQPYAPEWRSDFGI